MIGSQLTINAARRPDKVAVVYGERRLTYAALNERACRLANGLAALGIGPGDRVAALLHNCPQFFEALFATARIGAVFVPVNFRLVAREVGVVGVPDEHWGESVAAFVVRAPGAAVDAESVIAHCREHLAGDKKPRQVLFVDSLPRGTTNKVDKRALRSLFADVGAGG